MYPAAPIKEFILLVNATKTRSYNYDYISKYGSDWSGHMTRDFAVLGMAKWATLSYTSEVLGYTVPSIDIGYTDKVWATQLTKMGYTGKAWATEGYTVPSMGHRGYTVPSMGYGSLHSTKHGLHSTEEAWATQAKYGLHSTKYGLHRQSMDYRGLHRQSMGYRGLHRQSMGYRGLHRQSMRGLHRQSMGYRDRATQY